MRGGGREFRLKPRGQQLDVDGLGRKDLTPVVAQERRHGFRVGGEGAVRGLRRLEGNGGARSEACQGFEKVLFADVLLPGGDA